VFSKISTSVEVFDKGSTIPARFVGSEKWFRGVRPRVYEDVMEHTFGSLIGLRVAFSADYAACTVTAHPPAPQTGRGRALGHGCLGNLRFHRSARVVYGPSSRVQPFLTYPRERALGYFDSIRGQPDALLLVRVRRAWLPKLPSRHRHSPRCCPHYSRLVVGEES
jgi:hypothetical protein